MQLAVALVLGFLLTGFALYRRRSRRLVVDYDNFVKIIVISFGVSTAISVVVLPSLLLAALFVVQGGKLTSDNLFGFDLQSILVSAVIGALITAGWSIKEYYDRIHLP